VHRPLYINLVHRFKYSEEQTALWIQSQQEYSFTFEHREDRKHNNVHAVLRQQCQEECTHRHRMEERADVNEVPAIAAIAPTGLDPAALRRK
jgi:hypothetical protein